MESQREDAMMQELKDSQAPKEVGSFNNSTIAQSLSISTKAKRVDSVRPFHCPWCDTICVKSMGVVSHL